MSKKLRARVEEELQVLYTCPAARAQHLSQCKPEFDYLPKISHQRGALSGSDVGDYFEQRAQLEKTSSLFCDSSKKATQRSYSRALLQSLFISSNKQAGFSALPQHRTPIADLQFGLIGHNAPLVLLLRRVSAWYYYHVMYSTPEVLLWVTSGCELLFRLLTPHQQLQLMSETVITLSSPAMALSKRDGKNAELLDALDTPLHTATFMSMLSMATQLAVAEAQQQQQQQMHGSAHGSVCAPFSALQPAALLQLRLARQQRTLDEERQQQQDSEKHWQQHDHGDIEQQQQQGDYAHHQQQQQQDSDHDCQQQQQQEQECVPSAACGAAFSVLRDELHCQQQNFVHVVMQQPQHTLALEADLQQQQLLGIYTSQISKVSSTQQQLLQQCCIYGQQQLAAASSSSSSGAVGEKAHNACLNAAVTQQQIHQWLAAAGAAASNTAAASSSSSSGSDPGIGCKLDPVAELLTLLQQQHKAKDSQQNAAVLRLLDGLLQGILYEHALEVDQLSLSPFLGRSQMQLLLSLRSRIITTLTQIQQQQQQQPPHLTHNPAETKPQTPDPTASHTAAAGSSNSGGSTCSSVSSQAVCASMLQRLLRDVLLFVGARQAMLPQIVYLGLQGKIKQICRQTQQRSRLQAQRQQQQQQQPHSRGNSATEIPRGFLLRGRSLYADQPAAAAAETSAAAAAAATEEEEDEEEEDLDSKPTILKIIQLHALYAGPDTRETDPDRMQAYHELCDLAQQQQTTAAALHSQFLSDLNILITEITDLQISDLDRMYPKFYDLISNETSGEFLQEFDELCDQVSSWITLLKPDWTADLQGIFVRWLATETMFGRIITTASTDGLLRQQAVVLLQQLQQIGREMQDTASELLESTTADVQADVSVTVGTIQQQQQQQEELAAAAAGQSGQYTATELAPAAAAAGSSDHQRSDSESGWDILSDHEPLRLRGGMNFDNSSNSSDCGSSSGRARALKAAVDMAAAAATAAAAADRGHLQQPDDLCAAWREVEAALAQCRQTIAQQEVDTLTAQIAALSADESVADLLDTANLDPAAAAAATAAAQGHHSDDELQIGEDIFLDLPGPPAAAAALSNSSTSPDAWQQQQWLQQVQGLVDLNIDLDHMGDTDLDRLLQSVNDFNDDPMDWELPPLPDSLWQQQQQQQQQSGATSSSSSPDTPRVPSATAASSSAARQQQQQWQLKNEYILELFKMDQYKFYREFSENSRLSWVMFMVNMADAGGALPRLQRLADAMANTLGGSASGHHAGSSSTGAQAIEYTWTVGQLCVYMEALFLDERWRQTALLTEGFGIMKDMYAQALRVIKDNKEAFQHFDLNRVIQRELIDKMDDTSSIGNYRPAGESSEWSSVQLKQITHDRVTVLMLQAALLQPIAGNNYKRSISNIKKEFKTQYEARNWISRAQKLVDGVRRLVRLDGWCRRELKRLKPSHQNQVCEVLEALPEFPISPAAAAAAAAAADESLPEDDILYSLFVLASQHQQQVKDTIDAFDGTLYLLHQRCSGCHFKTAVWGILQKALCIKAATEEMGGDGKYALDTASDFMRSVMTLMTCYMAQCTSLLQLPAGFKQEKIHLAISTLANDAMQDMINYFRMQPGLRSFAWLFHQAPGSTARETARRAFGDNRRLPESATGTYSLHDHGVCVYVPWLNHLAWSREKDENRGRTWNGLEHDDGVGEPWLIESNSDHGDTATKSARRALQIVSKTPHGLQQLQWQIQEQQQQQGGCTEDAAAYLWQQQQQGGCTEDAAAYLWQQQQQGGCTEDAAAYLWQQQQQGGYTEDAAAYLWQQQQQQAAAITARYCYLGLMQQPTPSDAECDHHSDADSDVISSDDEDTDLAAAAAVGASNGAVDEVCCTAAASKTFVQLQRQHAAVQRVLALQQQIAQAAHIAAAAAGNPAQPLAAAQQQQLGILHISCNSGVEPLLLSSAPEIMQNPAVLLQQYGSCRLDSSSSNGAVELQWQQQQYQEGVSLLLDLQQDVTTAHNILVHVNLDLQQSTAGVAAAAAAAAAAKKACSSSNGSSSTRSKASSSSRGAVAVIDKLIAGRDLPADLFENNSQKKHFVTSLATAGQSPAGHAPNMQQQRLITGAKIVHAAAAGSSTDGSSSSFRSLLWQVLTQLKPTACTWYEQWSSQQQQQPGSSSSSGVAAAAAAPGDLASPEIWDMIGRSIAADILVIPPAYRDLLENGWAGGAGRLLPGGSSSSSSGGSSSSSGGGDDDSSSSSRAAHMLAVQYARAARKQYIKDYDPEVLLMQLMLLQSLADQPDKLAELQPAAAAAVAAALAAATHAAQVGVQPLVAAVSEAIGGSSGSRSSGVTTGPSLYHLAAQYGVAAAAAPPDLSLPWLQFLNSYHALQSALISDQNILRSQCTRKAPTPLNPNWPDLKSSDPDRGPGFNPIFVPDSSLAAAAAVICSYPCTSCPRLETWLRDESDRYGVGKVPAVPLSWLPRSPLMPSQQQQQQQHSGPGKLSPGHQHHSGRCLPQRQQQQQCQHQSQHPGPDSNRLHHACCSSSSSSSSSSSPLLGCSYWLHADRLMSVDPSDWQQHLLSSSSSKDLALIADLCCDWCGKAIHPVRCTAAAAAGSSEKHWGCVGCCCVQYCSSQCAAEGDKVHKNNCWRIMSLARSGTCWQHHPAGDKHSRAFFDYCSTM